MTVHFPSLAQTLKLVAVKTLFYGHKLYLLVK